MKLLALVAVTFLAGALAPAPDADRLRMGDFIRAHTFPSRHIAEGWKGEPTAWSMCKGGYSHILTRVETPPNFGWEQQGVKVQHVEGEWVLLMRVGACDYWGK